MILILNDDNDKKKHGSRVAIWLHLSRIDKARLLQPTAEEMKGRECLPTAHMICVDMCTSAIVSTFSYLAALKYYHYNAFCKKKKKP